MAIPSRQIGWGTEENLLWQISKQLEYLTKVTSKIGNNSNTNVLAYSEPLTFPIGFVSMSLQCDGTNVNSFYTSETVNDLTELVALYNSTPEFQALGTYSASGTDVLVLTTTSVIKNAYCPSGELSINVFAD